MSQPEDYELTLVTVNRWDRENERVIESTRMPGRIIGPGIAAVDVRQLPWTTFHYAVVHLGSGRALMSTDLCEGCAVAAAEKVLAFGGWERPTEAVQWDPDAQEHVESCEIYGPCYPPPGINLPFKFRVLGHTPGQPLDVPEGIHAAGVLVPEDASDEEIALIMGELSKPWYERSE